LYEGGPRLELNRPALLLQPAKPGGHSFFISSIPSSSFAPALSSASACHRPLAFLSTRPPPLSPSNPPCAHASLAPCAHASLSPLQAREGREAQTRRGPRSLGARPRPAYRGTGRWVEGTLEIFRIEFGFWGLCWLARPAFEEPLSLQPPPLSFIKSSPLSSIQNSLRQASGDIFRLLHSLMDRDCPLEKGGMDEMFMDITAMAVRGQLL
jgi:hypothetical protein